MITIIIVVYKSDEKKLNQVLKTFSNLKIIIVDNSTDYNFSNIQISENVKIVSSTNIGNGAAINKALMICKTPLALYVDIDVDFPNNFISNLLEHSKKITNFNILVPNHGNLQCKEKIIEKYDGEASVMLFNLNKFKNKKIFDESYFLYFEETDLLFNCKNKSLKVFFIKDIVINHHRASSINNETKHIRDLRQWHYMWSMFYFYKKNFNFLKALFKVIPFLLKDFLMLIYYFIFFNKDKLNKRFFRLYGVICSIIGLKSFKR
tara:strand:+ start:48 stop:836 length:789 start_codon:yes stop_codon:yes gene_type:complete